MVMAGEKPLLLGGVEQQMQMVGLWGETAEGKEAGHQMVVVVTGG